MIIVVINTPKHKEHEGLRKVHQRPRIHESAKVFGETLSLHSGKNKKAPG